MLTFSNLAWQNRTTPEGHRITRIIIRKLRPNGDHKKGSGAIKNVNKSDLRGFAGIKDYIDIVCPGSPRDLLTVSLQVIPGGRLGVLITPRVPSPKRGAHLEIWDWKKGTLLAVSIHKTPELSFRL
jgi:hypothetical protein